jgi:hypothetical protein
MKWQENFTSQRDLRRNPIRWPGIVVRRSWGVDAGKVRQSLSILSQLRENLHY